MITTTIHPDILEDPALTSIVEHADETLRARLDYSEQLARVDWSLDRDDKARRSINLKLTDVFDESIVSRLAEWELKDDYQMSVRSYRLWRDLLSKGIKKSLKEARESISMIQVPHDA